MGIYKISEIDPSSCYNVQIINTIPGFASKWGKPESAFGFRVTGHRSACLGPSLTDSPFCNSPGHSSLSSDQVEYNFARNSYGAFPTVETAEHGPHHVDFNISIARNWASFDSSHQAATNKFSRNLGLLPKNLTPS